MTVWDSISTTFQASVRSVGTAVTLALAGVYLHQRGFVDAEGKRSLALISQQVTFPLFLFTKIIYCNQDWSQTECPDITKSLQDVWVLLIWPVYVVGCGIVVGYLVVWMTRPPPTQVRAVLAACALGNSTGLPITLLSVVHTNFPATSDLGRIDPTLFLSVYLLVYPAIQWGYGGWLLAPQEEKEDPTTIEDGTSDQIVPEHDAANQKTVTELMGKNVLNNTEIVGLYNSHRRGLSSADEGMYMSELNLAQLAGDTSSDEADRESHDPENNSGLDLLEEDEREHEEKEQHPLLNRKGFSDGYMGTKQAAPALPKSPSAKESKITPAMRPSTPDERKFRRELKQASSRQLTDNNPSLWDTLSQISNRCLQPPVVGAITGILVALFPRVRGIFVDLVDRSSSAPLQWFFDGLYRTGLSAVPINMMILGCNLSSSFQSFLSSKSVKSGVFLPMNTMVGIALGKMVLLPVVGILTTIVLQRYVLDIPDSIDGSFYLVMMIVFLCPTANNVMVMVELSGSKGKEGIAAVIALQYAIAPIVLSITMCIVIGFASHWS